MYGISPMPRKKYNPTISQEDAVKYCAEFIHEICSFANKDLSELVQQTFVDLYIYIHPGIKTITDGESYLYYEIDDECAGYLCGAAQRMPDIGELVAKICAFNVLNGKPLPHSFRSFAFSLISGNKIVASRAGSKAPKDFVIRWLAYEGVIFLRDAFDFRPLPIDDGSENSACDIVSEAFERFDIDIKPTEIRDWCSHRKHEAFRRRADILTNHHKDLELHKLGVIKRSPYFVPLA